MGGGESAGTPDAGFDLMNTPMKDLREEPAGTQEAGEGAEQINTGTIAETATGAAYGGALGAPGGPLAMAVGAVAGALAVARPESTEEGE